MRTSSVLPAVVCASSLAAVVHAAPKEPRKTAELFFALGPGSALCDNKKPDSDCAVDGGFAFGLGGSYRVHGHLGVGGELGLWGYKVRDQWKGQLTDPATDVKFSSIILAPFVRWYWFDDEPIDAYLQGGIGFGSFHGEAKNAGNSYVVDVSGFVIPIGIGAEYIFGANFRAGLQFLPYLQVSSKACEKINAGDADCHRVGASSNALPWRLALVGTVLL